MPEEPQHPYPWEYNNPVSGLNAQRELDILREDIRRMDTLGTRGVAALAAQLTDLAKDFGEFKSDVKSRFELEIRDLRRDVDNRFDVHMKQHREDKVEARQTKRFLVGTFVSSLLILVTLLVGLLTLTAHAPIH